MRDRTAAPAPVSAPARPHARTPAVAAALGLALAAALVLSATGCVAGGTPAAPTTASGPVRIDARQAKEMRDADPTAIVLDVRTPEEYAAGHIAGATLLPVTEIQARAASAIPDKEATYLVYCRSGNRSATAAALLFQMGYAHVYDFGGIQDWPYGTVTDG